MYPCSTIGFIDENSLYGVTANDCRSGIGTTWKFEEASRLSEGSWTDHRVLPWLLWWVTVNFPARQESYLRQTLIEYLVSICVWCRMEPHDLHLSALHGSLSKGSVNELPHINPAEENPRWDYLLISFSHLVGQWKKNFPECECQWRMLWAVNWNICDIDWPEQALWNQRDSE